MAKEIDKEVTLEDILQILLGEGKAEDYPEHLKQSKKGDSFTTDYENVPVSANCEEIKPGRQRHFTGREGVPQKSSGAPRLRDSIDPSDPETLPGPLKVTKRTPENPDRSNNQG